jgi:hypothetical protein
MSLTGKEKRGFEVHQEEKGDVDQHQQTKKKIYKRDTYIIKRGEEGRKKNYRIKKG